MTIRVVVAEDSLIVREGLATLLGAHAQIEVAAMCGDYDELIAAVESEKPDVVLTDIRMPPTGTDEGIRAATELRDSHPEVGVVVLSQYAEPAYAIELLEAGSEGRAYLLKERVSEPEQLIGAIGRSPMGARWSIRRWSMPWSVRPPASESPLERLTPRESEVLSEIAQGKNNAAVAASLVLSERAVEKHINSLFSKLGLTDEPDVNRRVKAVLLFLSEQGG